jgi:hypothetical protein
MKIHDSTSLPSATMTEQGAKSPATVAAAAAAAAKKKADGKKKVAGKNKPKGLKTTTTTTKKKRRKNMESYATFVHRILKQVHPEAGISKKAMVVMGTCVLASIMRSTSCCRVARPFIVTFFILLHSSRHTYNSGYTLLFFSFFFNPIYCCIIVFMHAITYCTILDDMVQHLFERIATEAKSLQVIEQFSKKHGAGRTTFTAKDVESAVALVLPGGAYCHTVQNDVFVCLFVVLFCASLARRLKLFFDYILFLCCRE